MRTPPYSTAHPLRVILTERQIQQLVPYFDRVRASAVAGSPGMLVGQFGCDTSKGGGSGSYYITVAFLDHDKAAVIAEAGRAEIPGSINSNAIHRRSP